MMKDMDMKMERACGCEKICWIRFLCLASSGQTSGSSAPLNIVRPIPTYPGNLFRQDIFLADDGNIYNRHVYGHLDFLHTPLWIDSLALFCGLFSRNYSFVS